MKNYNQHRFECLVCRKMGVLVPENWITGKCKFCASDMILPVEDLVVDQNIVYFPLASKAKLGLVLRQDNALDLERNGSIMELIKNLTQLIDSAITTKFEMQVKQAAFGDLRKFNELQLEIAKYKQAGNLGLLSKLLIHLKNTVAGLESLEETSTHYLFTQRISESGTLTFAMDKLEIEQAIGEVMEFKQC